MLKYIFLAIMIVLTVFHVQPLWITILYTVTSVLSVFGSIMILGLGRELITKPAGYLDKNEKFCLDLINQMAEKHKLYKFNVIAFALAHLFIALGIYHLMIPAVIIVLSNMFLYFAVSHTCTRAKEV